MISIKRILFAFALPLIFSIFLIHSPVYANIKENITTKNITMVEGEHQTLTLTVSTNAGTLQSVGALLNNNTVIITSIERQLPESKIGIVNVSFVASSIGACTLNPVYTLSLGRFDTNATVTFNRYNIEVISPNFTVSFEKNGGICPVGSQSVSWGQPYGSLPTPSKAGYIFDGWFTEDGTLITNTTIFNQKSHVKLYAHWTPSKYSPYYRDLVAKGALNQFCINYVDAHRKELKKQYPTEDAFISGFKVTPELMRGLVEWGAKEGVEYVDKDYSTSKAMMETIVKAMIGRDLYDVSTYYRIANTLNPVYTEGLRLINDPAAYDSLLDPPSKPE